ncbi:MAG: ABC transporter ATP-binding protein [Solirubrobacterales bacterium]
MSSGTARQAVRATLLGSFRGRRRELVELVAYSLLEALPAFLSGRLVAQAIDHGFLAGSIGTGFAWLGVLGISAIVGAWGTRQSFMRLSALVEPFRDHLVSLAVGGALRRSTMAGAKPDTAATARLTQQVEIVREAYASSLYVVQGFVVTSVSAILGLLTLMPAILLLVVPPIVLGLGIFFAALGGLAARQRASIWADESIAEAAGTLTGALRDVVACGGEKQAGAVVEERIEAQARATRELARFTAIRVITIALGGWLPMLLILAAGPWLIDQGATTGTILGALTYIAAGVHPALESLVQGLAGSGLWLFVTLRRIVETAPPEEPQAPQRRQWPVSARRDLRLGKVTFGYGPWSEPVIRGLDLEVPDGDHLAIVGPSGIGKSTLAGLIAGLLEPQAGKVRIGGIPLGDLDPGSLSRHRVLIPQEAYVFGGTLRENLVYLRDIAETREIDATVDALGMRALVDRIGGYDAEISSSGLSAGERQLITLARAHLSDAPLMILDEAACHVDPATETRIEAAFAHRPGTLIVIAHRISSAMRARRILLLDGTDALLGSHRDLMRQSALYRDLVGHWQPVAAPAHSN